jgi:hypothetical protein
MSVQMQLAADDAIHVVPVLSVNRYDMRPSSSGIEELRTTVPAISGSLMIRVMTVQLLMGASAL